MKKTQVRQLKTQNLPTSLKTIIVLDIILVIFFLFAGVSFFTGSSEIKNNPEAVADQVMKELQQYPTLNISAAEAKEYVLRFAEVAPYIGAGLILIALIHGVTAGYLWKRKSWARIVQIVIALLFIAYALFTISAGAVLMNIGILLIEGWIASYLLFTQEGKSFFTK